MISLEHIRTLESKVTKAVSMMMALQEENQQLKAKLALNKARIEELEFTVEEFQEDQSEIEQGIMQALQHLDNLENAVGGLKPQAAVAPAPVQASEAASEAEAEAGEQATAPDSDDESLEETEQSAPEGETHWEAPVQQFQQPAPIQQEEYESIAPAVEVEAAPAREQQLDIF